MNEQWEYAVCDDNGEMHVMPEEIARAAIIGGRVDEHTWSVWRRPVQVGEWQRADGAA